MADLTREQVISYFAREYGEPLTKMDQQVLDLALIGLDAGEGWRERAAERCRGFAATGRKMMRESAGDGDREKHKNYFAQCLAAEALADMMLHLPSADADQRRAASMSEYRRVTAQGGSILPPHQSAAAQDQSSEARRELAPLEQEDTERASPAKGHTPASAADPLPAEPPAQASEQAERDREDYATLVRELANLADCPAPSPAQWIGIRAMANRLRETLDAARKGARHAKRT